MYVQILGKKPVLIIKDLKLGNVYKTREEVCFALERAKVKAELKRYALEHNDPEKEAWNNDNGHYMIAFNHRVNDLFITRGYYIEEESATCFTSAPMLVTQLKRWEKKES